MENNVLEELKSLDIMVMKKLFNMTQKVNVNYRITPIQIFIIKFLLENNLSCYQKDLYNFTRRGKSTVSSVLTTMEKNGLILKKGEDIDSKNVKIYLTEEAKVVYIKLQDYLKDFSNQITAGVSLNELKVFNRVISKMKENVDKKGD